MNTIELNDEELERYSRQLLIPEWDAAGQLAMKGAHAAIVGLGGLGSVVSQYLSAAGVGTLSLFDHDQVELSNLARQTLYGTSTVGQSKVEAAIARLSDINPWVNFKGYNTRFDPSWNEKLDCLIDCTDNFSSRYLLNQWCLKNSIPLISGAAIGTKGQHCVFNFKVQKSPCYHCLFPEPETPDNNELSCNDNGVLNPILGMVGSCQTASALRIILNQESNEGSFFRTIDGATGHSTVSRLVADPNCPVCSKASAEAQPLNHPENTEA